MSDEIPTLEWRVVNHSEGLVSSTIRSMSAALIHKGDMYIMGGKGVGLLDAVWRFDRGTGQWDQLETTGYHQPCPRDGHSITGVNVPQFPYDFVIFGGQKNAVPQTGEPHKKMASKVKTVAERSLLGDMFGFNIAKAEWTRLDPPVAPPMRRGHSTVLWKKSGADMVVVEEPKPRKFHHGDDFDEVAEEKEFKKRYAAYIKERDAAALSNIALIVYGGSGIDPMRGEEKTLNDIWEYYFNENTWRMVTTTGPRPSGAYNHACVVTGDTMLVSGGITPPKFNEPAETTPGPTGIVKKLAPTCGGMHLLDLSTKTWTFLRLCGPDGNDFPFALSDHQMVLHPTSPGRIFMFGGRQTITPHATIKKALPKPNRRGSMSRRMSDGDAPGFGLYEIDLQEETIDPVETRGQGPVSRFGHVLLSLPEWHPSDVAKRPAEPVVRMRVKQPPRDGGRPMLLVYGGNRSGQGGYCRNEVYELFDNPAPPPVSRRPGSPGSISMAVGESGLDAEMSQELEETLGGLRDMGSGTGSQMFANMSLASSARNDPGGRRSPSPTQRPDSPNTILTGVSKASERRSVRKPSPRKAKPDTLWVKTLRPILGPPTRGKPRSPSNFHELKLALSYPLSAKVADETSDDELDSPSQHKHGSNHSGHGHEHGHSEILGGVSPGKGSRQNSPSKLGRLPSPEKNPFPPGSPDYKRRERAEQQVKALALAPLITGMDLTAARGLYSKVIGPPPEDTPKAHF